MLWAEHTITFFRFDRGYSLSFAIWLDYRTRIKYTLVITGYIHIYLYWKIPGQYDKYEHTPTSGYMFIGARKLQVYKMCVQYTWVNLMVSIPAKQAKEMAMNSVLTVNIQIRTVVVAVAWWCGPELE